MPLDRMRISGLTATGHHGVFAHEREQGQPYVVDVTLHLDTGPAAADDDLSRTVDYGRLAEQITATIVGEPVNLIETLAQRVADLCLDHPAAQLVEVTVHKPKAPIAVAFEDVALTITRSRP